MRNNLFYEPINYFRVTSLIENYVYLCNCRTTHGELHRVYARIPQHSVMIANRQPERNLVRF